MDRVEASGNSVDVSVSGDLAKRDLHQRNKRATDICTNTSRRSFIDARFVGICKRNKMIDQCDAI